MRTLLMLVLMVQAASAQSVTEVQIRTAVRRALPILQRSDAEFVAKRTCVSCHHNVLAIMTFHMARDRGFTIDPKVLTAVEQKSFNQFRNANAFDNAVQASTLNDPTPDESYLLMAAHAAGLKKDLITEVYARRLAEWQRDGHWVTSDFRPPHSSSLFTATATAIRAIRLYMPDELAAETEAVSRRARQWLIATRPASTEDAAFRLLGLVWAAGSADEIAGAQRDLIAIQKTTGGWAELPGYATDAYSTGEALFALHEAGVPATDAAWRKGLRFLISIQAPDGTWHVRTRMISPADVSPPYFKTGFPYGKDEFLSYAGSEWAVMALLSALPEPANTTAAPSVNVTGNPAGTATEPPSWARTALFGTPAQLSTLLGAGLDPNSKTKNGTTLLMMSALDPEKIRMLVGRGADVKARVTSGTDALTIASAYYGSTPALRALIDAGAEAQAPDDVRVRRTPLTFAAMTGDLENVKLLLAHGADPEAGTAISDAVTFGYPEVVRTLIKAGADATLTESSGVNLLHWAAIINRYEIIPVLAEAGVPLNVKDEAGYTPLMYAATIDFGDTEGVKALLKAGADKSIRNSAGRTALQQARFYGHASLEAALR